MKCFSISPTSTLPASAADFSCSLLLDSRWHCSRKSRTSLSKRPPKDAKSNNGPYSSSSKNQGEGKGVAHKSLLHRQAVSAVNALQGSLHLVQFCQLHATSHNSSTTKRKFEMSRAYRVFPKHNYFSSSRNHLQLSIGVISHRAGAIHSMTLHIQWVVDC